MADDLAGFIAALGLNRPLIFGYSDGGQIALELAVRHPGASRGLIVAAAAFRLTESIRKGVEAMRATLTGPEVLAFLKSLHTWNPEPEYVPRLIDQVLGMAYTDLNYEPEDFKMISDPTLIMLGDRDGVMDVAQAVDLFPLIPVAELAIVPNTSHMSALNNPVFLATALDFLLRHREQQA
jgi:pimeloyl-ACP methyl ester carboxylesterase